jgi:hypothetical protein
MPTTLIIGRPSDNLIAKFNLIFVLVMAVGVAVSGGVTVAEGVVVGETTTT